MATRFALVLAVLAGFSVSCQPEKPPSPLPTLPGNAPKDQPFQGSGADKDAEYQAAIAPYIAKARQTWPEAKKRYLEKLPPGHVFYAVTVLRDKKGNTEQVFVVVASIKEGRIMGRIASEIMGVMGYKQGDVHSFSENELVDWLISRPDGTEEGNVVGNFLDEWQKTRRTK